MTAHRHARRVARPLADPWREPSEADTPHRPRQGRARPRGERDNPLGQLERELLGVRQPARWPGVALALLLAAASAAGGCNSGPFAAAFASASGLLAAAVFAGPLRIEARKLLRPAPLLLALWLGWIAASSLARAAGLGRPLLAPDLLPLAAVRLGGTLAIFLAAARIGTRPGGLHAFAIWMARLTAPLLVFGALLTVVELPQGWAWLAPWLGIEPAGVTRLAAPIGNPNANGVLFAMLALLGSGIAIARAQAWYDLPSDRRLMAMLASIMLALGAFVTVALTQSRTALLLLLGMEALLCMLAAEWPRRRSAAPHAVASRRQIGRAAGIAAIAAVIALGLAAAGATLDRLGLLAEAHAGRLGLWRTWLALLGEVPLAGHGLGSFAEFNLRHLTPATALAMWNFGAAHAGPLQIVIETGWPGLVLAAAFLLALAVDLVSGQRRQDPVRAAALVAVLLAMLASCVDIALNVPAIAGLAAALAGLCWGRSWRSAPAV